MAAYQLGSGVGTVVGPSSDDKGSVGDVLSLGTDAGQALLVAAIGFGILLLTIGREGSGVIAKLGRVVEFVVVIAAATWVVNYAVRSYVITVPNGPLADGLRIDN